MPTDFERDLSELLHALTPEPPDHLAPPRIATLPEARRADAGTAVIELAPAPRPAPRRQRWWPVVAAAAVTALAVGLLTLARVDDSGHPATHQPAETGVTSPSSSAPQCADGHLVVSRSRVGLTTHGSTGTARFAVTSTSARPCTMLLPTVAIGVQSSGGLAFPASGGTVRIPSDGKLVMTAHVRINGRCRTVDDGGLWLNATMGPGTYSYRLGVTGCTLTPLRLTQHVG